MFGYLFMDKDKLTLQERKIFRDYYCSICLSLKHNYGNLMRLTLNYDIVYLAMIVDSGINIPNCGKCGKRVKNGKCVFTQSQLSKLADYNVLLVGHKLKDDIKDDKTIKLKIYYKYIQKKIKKRNLQNADEEISQLIDKYNSIECADMPIESKMVIFADCMCDTVQLFFGLIQERINLLHALFQYLLLIDAVDDFYKDFKNCTLTLFSGIEDVDEFNRLKPQLHKLSDKLIETVQRDYEKCNFTYKIRTILKNLIYDYLPKLNEQIFSGTYKKTRRKIL